MWNGKKMFCAMWLKISLLISKIFHITRLLLMCAQDKRHVLCLCFWETCHSMPKTHHFMSLAKSFWITHIQTHIWETKNWLKRNPNMLVRYWKSNKNLNQIEADGWTLATVIFMMRHYEFRIYHYKYQWCIWMFWKPWKYTTIFSWHNVNFKVTHFHLLRNALFILAKFCC